MQSIFQKLRLASLNFDMNRVLAIQKNRMSQDWFSADLLCHQSPEPLKRRIAVLEKKKASHLNDDWIAIIT